MSTPDESSLALFRTELDLPGRREGKVRDVYTLGHGEGSPRLLVIATDRISAFDVVMPTPIPGKGVLLNRIASWWLRWIEAKGLCKTHLLSTDEGEIPEEAFIGSTSREDLAGRVTIGRLCRVVPVECVVRGYLEGSGWEEYRGSGKVCGVGLPPGLERGSRLPEPIFTPATKAERGAHDENIGFDEACAIAGAETMRSLRDRSLAIYRAAAEHAESRGLILADTKFEFGFPLTETGDEEAEAVLIDEALTPDSSRYWPRDRWRPGGAQESFDKQFVREHLLGLVSRGKWDKSPPGPELPPSVVRGTLERYAEAERRLCEGG